jgi:hypothetical protein
MTYSATILAESSLVSYYRHGEATPGTGTCADLHGSNPGTYVASPTSVAGLLTGDSDTAVLFNGTTQKVAFATATGFPIGSAARSIEFWFKSSDTTGTYKPLYGYGMANVTQTFKAGYDAGRVWAGTGGTDLFYGSGYCDGARHHVVVYNESATSIRVWVDGSDLGAQTCPTMNTVIWAPDGGIGWFGGSYGGPATVDEVAVYNAALTSTQVAAHYAAGITAGVTAGVNIQDAVNSTTTGGTLVIPAGTYHELVTISRAITISATGAVIDATGLGVALQHGALTITGTGVSITGLRVTGSSGAGLDVNGGNTVRITNVELDNNIQLGYHVSGASDVVFSGCHIHHNNVARTIDPAWEAGGGKVVLSSGVIFDGCEADHNAGPGIWYDIDNTASEVKNCQVHDNERGIMFEISDGALIHDNVIWANMHPDGWYWAAGILISSSKNAEVYSNVVHSGATGIVVLSQNRGGSWNTVSGNSVHDNDVVMTAKDPANNGEYAALAFVQDWAGTIETGSNHEAANRFWFPAAEPGWDRFGMWGGATLDTIAKLNASSLSAGASRYLTDAEMNALPPVVVIAAGTSRYISPSGSDSTGAGTVGNPWRTLVKLYSMLGAGETGYCRGGSYSVVAGQGSGAYVATVGTAAAPITVRNYPGETPVFYGSGGSTDGSAIHFRFGASHHVVDGLTFLNFRPYQSAIVTIGDQYGTTHTEICDYIAIRNCHMDFGAWASGWNGNTAHMVYASSYSNHVTVEDNTFVGRWPTNIPGAALEIYHAPPSTNWLFQRNVVNGLRYGVQVYETASTGSILHNTFVGCDFNIDASYHSTLLVRNNAGTNGSANLRDPNNSAYTTADHNFWGQTFDANYFLLAGNTGVKAASDGLDAGALNAGVATIRPSGIASREAFGTVVVTVANTLVVVGGAFAISAVGAIASAGAFGTIVVVITSATTITGVGGISSAETFGGRRLLLEDGSGGYLLEDGSGVLLLEGSSSPVVVTTAVSVGGVGGIEPAETFGVVAVYLPDSLQVIGVGAIYSEESFGVVTVGNVVSVVDGPPTLIAAAFAPVHMPAMRLWVAWDGVNYTDESASVLSMKGVESADVVFRTLHASELDISLDNTTRRYDPTNPASPIYSYLTHAGQKLYIELGYNGFYVVAMTGWIRTLKDNEAAITTEVVVQDLTAKLQDVKVNLAPGSGHATGWVASQLIAQAGLASGEDYSFDTGDFVTRYSAAQNANLMSDLSLLALAEGGRLYCDTDGLLRFKSRTNHIAAEKTVVATLNRSQVYGLDHKRMKSSIVTRLTLTYDDRENIITPETVFQLQSGALGLKGGTSVGIYGPDGHTITGWWVSPGITTLVLRGMDMTTWEKDLPVDFVDITTLTITDGIGTPITPTVYDPLNPPDWHTTLTPLVYYQWTPSGPFGYLTFYTLPVAPIPLFVTALVASGKPGRVVSPFSVQVNDLEAQDVYGVLEQTISNPYWPDPSFAMDRANELLALASGRIASIDIPDVDGLPFLHPYDVFRFVDDSVTPPVDYFLQVAENSWSYDENGYKSSLKTIPVNGSGEAIETDLVPALALSTPTTLDDAGPWKWGSGSSHDMVWGRADAWQ